MHYTGTMTTGTTSETPRAPADADLKYRFIFEGMDLRGELVNLTGVLGDIGASHSYPHGVVQLLGEFATASVLLASTLKFRGALTVQARSERQLPLVMAECNSRLEVRAIARGAQEAVAEDFAELLGGGQLAITVTPERGERYQGIVSLAEESLARSLDSYFGQSEQLHTRLLLACDGQRAAGMLLQQLPAQRTRDPQLREEHWQHVNHLAATLTDDELLSLPAEQILKRLFHEDSVRLFAPEPVRFSCSCSRERTLGALATIGRDEIDDILREQGSVTMDCEFCNQRYVFSAEELTRPGSSSTLH